MRQIREEQVPVENSDDEMTDVEALLTSEVVAFRGEVHDLRRRLKRLERQSGQGLPHPSDYAQEEDGPGSRQGVLSGGAR